MENPQGPGISQRKLTSEGDESRGRNPGPEAGTWNAGHVGCSEGAEHPEGYLLPEGPTRNSRLPLALLRAGLRGRGKEAAQEGDVFLENWYSEASPGEEGIQKYFGH